MKIIVSRNSFLCCYHRHRCPPSSKKGGMSNLLLFFSKEYEQEREDEVPCKHNIYKGRKNSVMQKRERPQEDKSRR